MYWDHFRLREKAFANTPDPRFLFLNETYEEALNSLLYAVEERELALLVGDIGMGKSMLIRALMDRLDERHEVAAIVNPRLAPAQFLRTVAQEFGIKDPSRSKADLLGCIQDRLVTLDREGRVPVLVVDEAQLIPSKAVFDEVRLLSNFQLDDRNLVALLFVGQMELKKRLERRAYRPLTQRLAVTVELRPLAPADTRQYVQHRLWVAGSDGSTVFSDEALTVIYESSRGIPRLINTLATQCLLEGLGRGSQLIDGVTAQNVVSSLMFPAS